MMQPGDRIRFLRTIPSSFEGSPPLAELNELGTIMARPVTGRLPNPGRASQFAQVLTERGTLFEANREDFELIISEADQKALGAEWDYGRET